VKPGGSDIWRGSAPNPNLAGVVHRRGPNKSRQSTGANATPARPAAPKPSLASHLVTKLSAALAEATQKSFLSHAGCGTLSAAALKQWLAQEIHISRALVPFVGSLIGKVRIPETSNLTSDPTYRAIDLLCSAVNNMKKELEFLESTKRKYDLRVDMEEPQPATQGFIDLLASASSPDSSLLEGLVILWATEHVRCRLRTVNCVQPLTQDSASVSRSNTLATSSQPCRLHQATNYRPTSTRPRRALPCTQRQRREPTPSTSPLCTKPSSRTGRRPISSASSPPASPSSTRSPTRKRPATAKPR